MKSIDADTGYRAVSFSAFWRDDRRVVLGPHSGGPSMNDTALTPGTYVGKQD